MEDKILQMLPAVGWYATYDGVVDHFDPVACFALVEETLDNGRVDQLVVAMTADGGGLSRVDRVSNISGLHYLPDYKPAIPKI